MSEQSTVVVGSIVVVVGSIVVVVGSIVVVGFIVVVISPSHKPHVFLQYVCAYFLSQFDTKYGFEQ